MRKKILHYRTEAGKIPYQEWFDSLNDDLAKSNIVDRMDRVASGNLGDHRTVGGGVIELRSHIGKGYRIYLGQHGMELVILLCGSKKANQQKTISKAHEYWKDYRRRI